MGHDCESGAAQLGWRTNVPLLPADSSSLASHYNGDGEDGDTDGGPVGNVLLAQLWETMATQAKTFNKSEKPSRNHHTEASERPNEDGSRPEMRGRTKGHNNAG